MIVVSDTSVLTNLAAIRKFDLLCGLYGSVHVANGVWAELNAGGERWPGSREAESAERIRRLEVQNDT
jgi:predicted nucleic acid-binding protein